jgi:hypothetical protein
MLNVYPRGNLRKRQFHPGRKIARRSGALSVELEIKPTGWRLLRVKKAG